MPKRNTSEHSSGYAEQYADETMDDRKQSNFALDHPPDDWRQTDFAHRFTDELKAMNDSAAAAAFLFLLTHSRLMPKRDRCRALRWNDFRSASDSTRWAGTGTSRPRFALLPGAEHDAHGHPGLVTGCSRTQLPGLLGGEVVGKSLGLARHGKDRFRDFRN